MKRILIIHFSIFLLLIACQNKEKSFINSNKNSVIKLENKFFYLDFIYPEGSSEYQKIIELVKQELLHNSYILSKDPEKKWQGVRAIQAHQNITISDTNKYYPSIHKFKDFSEYNSNDKKIEKIVITLNKPINDSIPNFNFCLYKKLEHKKWQSVFNPGNFRYKEKKAFDKNEFANWIVRKITLLTFK